MWRHFSVEVFWISTLKMIYFPQISICNNPIYFSNIRKQMVQTVGGKAKGWISKCVFQKNRVRQMFRKTNILWPLIRTHTCAYQGVRNIRSFRKFGVLCFLETPVLRFTLLPHYRRDDILQNTSWRRLVET